MKVKMNIWGTWQNLRSHLEVLTDVVEPLGKRFGKMNISIGKVKSKSSLHLSPVANQARVYLCFL